MADNQGKTGFDDGGNTAGETGKAADKKAGDYAGKQERSQFKQELFGDKKRRRRRRRHGKRDGEALKEIKPTASKIEPEVKPESKVEPELKPELKPESFPKFQDKPTEPKSEPVSSQPINPFSAPINPSGKSLPVEVEDHGFGPSPNRPINPFLQTDMEPADEGDEAEVGQVEEVQEMAKESVPEVAKEPEALPKLEPEVQPINPFVKESLIENKREVIDVTPEEGGGGDTPEVVQVAGGQEAVSDSSVGEQSEEDDFKQEFWTILDQAGITKKRILIFLIALVVIIFGLIIFFSWGEDDDDDLVDRDGDSAADEDGGDDSRGSEIALEIVSSYIFGLEYVPGKPKEPIEAVPITEFGNIAGIEAGFVFGDLTEVSRDSFVTYIDLLRRMDSIYNTDVYSLVNLSTDRRAALTNHLSEVDSVIIEGLAVYNLLEQQLGALDAEYIRVTEQRDLYEVSFFEDLAVFSGQNAYEKLNLFREFSKSALDLKADYNAKKTVRDMLVTSLNLLRPRYEDLVTNSEALIKGVKVFDLPGSDIDAIVPVE